MVGLCDEGDEPSCPIRKKVKVKLSLYFYPSTTPRRRIGEWRYSSTHFLTSALDEDEWSASLPHRFTPRERAHCTIG
jgi:hypothetical protein